MTTSRVPRVALVLGAGGIAGYSFHTASLGAIKELTGWDPRTADLIIGTSAGSAVGALVAGNVPVEEMLGFLLTAPTDPAAMSKLRVVSGRGLASPFGFGLTGAGMTIREMMRFPRTDLMRAVIGLLPKGAADTTVVGEDARSLHGQSWPRRPFWVNAVDAGTGRRVVFGRDRVDVSVDKAVEASCSVPGLLRPVEIGDRVFVDGGVHSATSAELVLEAEEPFDLVVVLSPMSQQACGLKPSVNRALRVWPAVQLKRELELVAEAGVPAVVIEPDAELVRAVGPNPMDPTKVIPVLMEASRSAFEVLSRSSLAPRLDILRTCAELVEPPADVPIPAPLFHTRS